MRVSCAGKREVPDPDAPAAHVRAAPVSEIGSDHRRKPCRGPAGILGTSAGRSEVAPELHVAVACSHLLLAVMFKAPLPATRVIARRLYSTRGMYLVLH